MLVFLTCNGLECWYAYESTTLSSLQVVEGLHVDCQRRTLSRGEAAISKKVLTKGSGSEFDNGRTMVSDGVYLDAKSFKGLQCEVALGTLGLSLRGMKKAYPLKGTFCKEARFHTGPVEKEAISSTFGPSSLALATLGEEDCVGEVSLGLLKRQRASLELEVVGLSSNDGKVYFSL